MLDKHLGKRRGRCVELLTVVAATLVGDVSVEYCSMLLSLAEFVEIQLHRSN
jgi:hypothetical protein